jgi:peptidoglycan biosynthesis protein MviN/MurJ (putative lipid II flippase)
MRADLLFLGMHIPLSLLLIWRFGYFGTVVGTSLALSISRVYLYGAGARTLGVPVWELMRFSFIQPALGASLALAAAVIPQVAGAPPSLPMLLGEGALFAATYTTYVSIFAVDHYDRQLARSLLLRPFGKAG